MSLKQEIDRAELIFKSDLLNPGKNPLVEQGLAVVISELIPAKSLYAYALENSLGLKMKTPTEEDRERLEQIIGAAKNGFIAMQTAIDALYDIRRTLRRPPVILSARKEVRRNG